MINSNQQMKTTYLSTAFSLLAFVANPVLADAVRSEDAAAVQVVQHFNDTMTGLLKDSASLGYKGRFDRLHSELEKTFDLAYMAEKAVGQFWTTLSEEEKVQWRQKFADFMSANYASRLNRWNDQKFEVVSSQASGKDTTIIETKISEPGNDDVQLSYRMRETPQGWRIIDVYYNGTVSELALRRADYGAVLKKDGFAALIASVTQKIADMEAGKNA